MSLAPQSSSARSSECFDRQHRIASSRGKGAVEAQLRQERNQYRSQLWLVEESGFLLLDMTMKEKLACETSLYHRMLAKVSLCGRTVLSTTVLQVQTFCCSWWQSLIMCSTKQELWVM